MDIPKKVASLNLPENKYVVVSGGVLAAHGIRETQDIDIVVTQDLYDNLKSQGWKELSSKDDTRRTNPRLQKDIFDVSVDLIVGNFRQKTGDLVKSADIINGIPFASLHDTMLFKKALGRKKDHKDVEMIQEFIDSQDKK